MDNSRKRATEETQCWYRELSIDTEGSFCERSPESESESADSEESNEVNSEFVIIRDPERDQDEEQVTAKWIWGISIRSENSEVESKDTEEVIEVD